MTVIRIESLSKRFGDRLAVDQLSFAAPQGRVTGLLGPNGSGKTTTLRILLGLSAPTSGRATLDGKVFCELRDPCRTVGAVVEGATFHPGRSGRQHLRILARQAGLPSSRADEVLALLDLTAVDRARVGGYSFGMRQRLGLAAALLGDPGALVLDEAANGLDPEGIHWFRDLMRALAGEGRTILLSSHVLSEVAQTIDDVVVIKDGRLLASSPLEDLLGGPEGVILRTPDISRLRNATAVAGAQILPLADGRVEVRGVPVETLAALTAGAGVRIYEMSPQARSLEDAYLTLTRDAVVVAA